MGDGHHFPRLKRAPGAIFSGLVLAMSLQPNQAVGTLRFLIHTVGFPAPIWLNTGWLQGHAQQIVAASAFALLVWCLWPSKRVVGKQIDGLTVPRPGWTPIDKVPFPIRRDPEFAHDIDGPDSAFLPRRFMDHHLSSGSIDLPAPRG